MEFRISDDVSEKYPQLKIGVLVFENINNKTKDDNIMNDLREVEKQLREKHNIDSLSEINRIVDWREAYRSFGAKPKKCKSSVEALSRRVLSDEDIPDINPLVNIYNTISLKYLVPVGGDDLENISDFISLNIAKGDEKFVVLGGSEEEHPREGEVVYMDSEEVLCRRWNWRECNKSKMTEEIKRASIVIEGLDSLSEDELREAMADLKEKVVSKLGATFVKEVVLDKDNSSFDL